MIVYNICQATQEQFQGKCFNINFRVIYRVKKFLRPAVGYLLFIWDKFDFKML
jgi:hypothetical protein